MPATAPDQPREARPAATLAERVRGVVGLVAFTVGMGVLAAVSIALVLVVTAALAITVLG